MTKEELTKHLISKQKFLYHSAYQLTKQRDDAWDLTQTVILKALTQYEKITHTTNIDGWLYTIMKNVFLNQCRNSHEIHLITKNSEDESSSYEIPIDAGESADSRCIVRDITNAIDSLEKEYRIPFGLYVSGYKYEEIAAKMNMPLGTVKSRIFTARKKTQHYLDGEAIGRNKPFKIIIHNAHSTILNRKTPQSKKR